MVGRKPKPNSVRVLEGMRGHRPLKAVPKAMPEQWDVPEGLGEYAREEWERITPELFRLGLLTRLDRVSLKRYVRNVELHERACAKYQKATESAKTNPQVCAMLLNRMVKLGQEVRRDAQEFGLTPVSRQRLTAKDQDAGEDDLDRMLK